MSYPKLFAPHINGKLVLVKDLPATILELAGAKHPGTRYRGRAVYPMTGRSIVDLLQGEDAAPRAHADELLGKRSVRQGDWKLIHMPRPYGPDDWQLYNLANDLAETTDLAGQRPEKAAELKAIWDEYERTNNIVLPDWVSGY